MAGPYYESNWRDFRHIYAAAGQGLKFTYQLRPPAALEGINYEARRFALDALTDADIAAGVREQVSAVLNDPIARNTVSRWSLSPEEIRYWVPSEMRYLRVANETIREVEQEHGVTHRPFWAYEPNHRNTAALLMTGVHQDIVSKGVYLTNMPRGPQRSAYAMWSYSQITGAANTLQTLPQAILQLSTDFTDPLTGVNPVEIRRVLRHDAYLGLVMGIKSFNVWSMSETRPNLTTHNEQFQAYASVAQDLTGDLNLQQAFLFGEPRTDLKLKITEGTKLIKYVDQYGLPFQFSTLHSFNAAVGEDRYLFLVNSTEQPMEVKVSGLPKKYMLEDLFAGTATQMKKSSFKQQLDVLGVAALRFSPLWSWSAGSGSTALRVVPEPSTALLAALAAARLILHRRRRTN
jgi:hypothetical protein